MHESGNAEADHPITSRLSLSLTVIPSCHILLVTIHMSYKRPEQKGPDDLYATTVARIQKIQSQLANAPRGIRLKDKVCVVTGVGSMKGIGYGHL
jgi:hypothetical protein